MAGAGPGSMRSRTGASYCSLTYLYYVIHLAIKVPACVRWTLELISLLFGNEFLDWHVVAVCFLNNQGFFFFLKKTVLYTEEINYKKVPLNIFLILENKTSKFWGSSPDSAQQK